jgi:hypothetical protein
MRSPPLRSWAFAFLFTASAAIAQAPFPDRLYYQFNEGTGVGGTTANLASPGVGTPLAAVTGHSLTGGVGVLGTGALVGATPANTANFVNTGWTTAFGTGSWTISYRADVSTLPTATLYYVCGDSTAGGIRVFYNGVAGAGNAILRGGFTDVLVAGAGVGGAHTVTFVYDATVPAIYGYLDATLVSTVPQAALNIFGTAPFRVGGYSSASWSGGAILDEFRMYSYALTAPQVAAGVNVQLQNFNELTAVQSGPGVGDFTLSLNNISPTAVEGWTLATFATTGPVSTGPLFGIFPDAGTWLLFTTTPLTDSNPFHFPVPSAFGGFPNVPFALPAGAVSFLAGTTADFVVFLVQPGFAYDGRSNVARLAFN